MSGTPPDPLWMTGDGRPRRATLFTLEGVTEELDDGD